MGVTRQPILSAVLIATLFLGSGARIAAQEAPALSSVVTHRVPGTDLPITIDGVMDEPAWDEALVLDLKVEAFPGENIPAPVETECRLTYDEKNFYLGCHALDPEPWKIRAHITDRYNAWRDDFLVIYLDTFND